MAIANIDVVKEVLKDFEPRLRAVEDRAFASTKQIPNYRGFIYGRTRSNIHFDFIVQEALAEFDGDPNIRVIVERQTVKFLFNDRVLVRFKKGNSKGIGGNIITQAVLDFIDPQLNIPGLLPDLHKVEVCHQVDELGLSLKNLAIVARDVSRRIWSYPIPAAGGAEVVPIPVPTNDLPPPPQVTPRGTKTDGQEEEEK